MIKTIRIFHNYFIKTLLKTSINSYILLHHFSIFSFSRRRIFYVKKIRTITKKKMGSYVDEECSTNVQTFFLLPWVAYVHRCREDKVKDGFLCLLEKLNDFCEAINSSLHIKFTITHYTGESEGLIAVQIVSVYSSMRL